MSKLGQGPLSQVFGGISQPAVPMIPTLPRKGKLRDRAEAALKHQEAIRDAALDRIDKLTELLGVLDSRPEACRLIDLVNELDI